MADDQVVTNIVARADFSDLIANVRKVTTSLAAMQQQIGSSNKVLSAQINAVNRSFGETLRSTGQFSTHFVSLANDVDTFGKRLDGGKLKLRDYFSTLQTHTRTSGGLIRDLARQQVQLQNAILQPLGRNAQGLMQFNVHVPQGLDQIKNKGAIARQEMQILNKVMQEGSVGLINWGKNTQWAGRQLTVGLTVPIVAFGAAAAKAFREADQELTRLTKVYGGLSATSSSELQKVRRDVTAVANELARGYGASFKETLALSADIAATGKQGSELLGSIRETTRLAVLGEVDRQDAMKATLAIQSAFRQDTDELAKSINFLNAVENQTSTTLNDLVEAIPKAGPIIKGLGGDIQDLALYLTAMKEGGINASEGANAIKSALASLINPTDVAVKKFQGFGIDLMGIVNNNAGDVTKTLFALQGALNKLDPLQKSQAIEQLFGKFQFARLSALFENLGTQGSQTLKVMDLMKASSKELESIASRELSMVTESASGKYKRAVEGLKANLAEVGEEFLKVSTFFINLVDGIIQFVNKLPAPVKTILTFLAGLTAVTGPLIMLTGVLANFLGYVIKGAFHLKALFKGGEGWRMLTPEILAAQKAGSLIEKTFYSDAKAALALAEALQVLSAGMTSIQSKMTQGVVSVQPMLSTVAGSIIKPPGDDGGGGGGGGIPRIVDPRNPLVGPAGTRASAHMVPRSGMTPEQRAAQTIHSFLPAPIPVNQAVGANPQIFASGDLPSVPGLTTILGKSGTVSTGVVSSEAAKWHTMIGALSMMTKTEVAQMKTQIRTTGTVTSEFTQAFGSLLPQMTSISENAARQSAIIVAEAKAGTISVQTARQRIIALNIQVEQLMAQATMGTASSLGRTAVLTGVPTLDQPVVDPKTGKSNMRELFKKGKTRSFVDDLARLMGVRTWGAGYSTHTTIPIRRNMGGKVYNPEVHGNVVPGDTSIDYDNTPAVLREGGFILNQSSSRVNPDLVNLAKNSKNAGGKIVPAILTPGETYFPPEIAQEIMPTLEKANSGSVIKLLNSGGMLGGRVSSKKLNYGVRVSPIDILSKLGRWNPSMARGARRIYDTRSSGSRASNSPRTFDPGSQFGPETYHSLFRRSSGTWGVHGGALRHGERDSDEVLGHVITSKFLKQFKGLPEQGSSRVLTGSQFESRFGSMPGGATASKKYQVLPDNLITITKDFNAALLNGSATGAMWLSSQRQPQHFISLLSHLLNSGVPYKVAYRVAGKTLARINKAMYRLKDTSLTETKWGNIVDSSMQAEISALSRSYTKGSMHSFNAGGIVPGGMVSGNRLNYGIPALAASAIARLTSRWKTPSPYSPATQKHDWTNTDPLHGPLFIGKADIGSEGVRRSLSYSIPSQRGGKQIVGISPMMSNDPRYLIERYMAGDKAVLARMREESRTGLNSHPLSIQSLFKSVSRRFRGTLYRGMTPQSVADTLPKHIVEAIERARATGDFSQLIGKAFIMRRASFTADPRLAQFFAPGSGGLVLQASLSGRRVTPTSEMFPDKKFQAPYGQDWSRGISSRRYRSEQESLVGGRFIITGFDGKKLIVEGRAMGGPVSGATPYMVGERGPELFVPKNSGGIIPNYALGGVVKGGKINYGELPPGWAQSLAQPTLADQMRASGELPSRSVSVPEGPQKTPRGMGVAGFLGGMGGSTLGYELGGKLTGGNQFGSILGSLVGYSAGDAALKGLIAKFSGVGKAAGAAANQTSLLSKAFQFFIKLPGPLKLLAAIVGVGLAIKTVNDTINEHRRIVTSGFGISEESAKKLGLQYKKLGSEMDSYQQKYDLMLAKAVASRYSKTKAEGKGIDITVPELEKLKKQVAKDFPDEIKMFDKATNEEAIERATNLKAGMVATGKSVEEANEIILAMIMNSNKSAYALDILGDRGFGKIQGKISATNVTVKTFSNVIKEGNFDQLPIALQTAVNALDNLQQSFIKTDDKTKKALTSSQAYEKVLGQISKTANQAIGEKGLEEILAQNEGLRDVISSTDTLSGIWAKIKLSTSGITFNLKDMSSETANTISLLLEQQKDYLASNDSLIGSAADLISKTGNITANQLIKNANKTKESIEKEIALRQKNIQKIKDEADAKKRALEEETQAEDFLLQIQKKQIEYSEALASGNMAGAAQAQLDIQSMTGARQLDLAKTAIDAKADKDIKKQQDLIEGLTSALDGLSKSLEKQLSAASSQQTKKANLQGLYDMFFQALGLGMAGVTADEKLIIADIAKQLRDSGVKEFVDLANKYLTMSPTGNYEGSMQPMGFGALESLATSSFKVVSGKLQVQDTATASAIEKLASGKNVSTITNLIPAKDPSTKNLVITMKDYLDSGIYAPGIPDGKQFLGKDNILYRIVRKQQANDNLIVEPVKKAAGGMIKNFMPGGNVTGPGTGTSDSIPAMLSNGEYVIKADSVKKYGTQTFDALNAGRFKDGGLADISSISVGDGKSLPVKPYGSIFKPKSLDPKDFKTIGEYYAAVKKVRKEGQFFTAPETEYPIDHIKSPMGSLQRFLDIARSQIGYDHAYQLHTDFYPKGVDSNATKFSLWGNENYKLGSDILDWCGMFIAWVAKNSGVGLSSKMFSGIQAIKDYKKKGLFNDLTNKENLANVKVGDLAWYDWDSKDEYGYKKDGLPDHAVIVSGVGKIIRTIGQYGDGRISERTSGKDQGMLLGSATPEFKKFANGGPVNTSALITPSVPYYMNYGGMIPGYYAGGMIKNFMPGGNVTGPGTGTSDSIPAMLSDGEYVIKASSVAKYGVGTFDALNAQRLATGGMPKSTTRLPGPMPSPAAIDNPIFNLLAKPFKYLGGMPKDIITSAITGAKYIAGYGTGYTNWMDPKDEKMYKQAERDIANGKVFQGEMKQFGRLATSFVDVVPKLIDWNTVWRRMGMKDLPGQTEYFLAQLPGEVIQDLFKQLIPGNYHDGGPVGAISNLPFAPQVPIPFDPREIARKEKFNWVVGGDDKNKDTVEMHVGDFTENERKVADLMHSWVGLLNTYYGSKYQNVFKLMKQPSLLENPIVTDLEIVGSRSWGSLLGGITSKGLDTYGYGFATQDMEDLPNDGSLIYMQPVTGVANMKELILPSDSGFRNRLQLTPDMLKKDADFETYSDLMASKILTDDTYKMSVLALLNHEFGHTLQTRLGYSKIDDDNSTVKSKLFTDYKGKPLSRKTKGWDIMGNMGEMNADMLSGAIMSEMYNAGYMNKIVQPNSVTKFLKNAYSKYGVDLSKTNTDIGQYQTRDGGTNIHAQDSKYRFSAYLQGFKGKNTDAALADYLGISIGDLYSDPKKAKAVVGDLSNYKLISDRFDYENQTSMPDLLNTTYAKILGLPMLGSKPTPPTSGNQPPPPIAGNKPIPHKALDIQTPRDFARALITAYGGTPTEPLIQGIQAWAMQEGGHWQNRALHNPLNTTLVLPGSTKVNTVNAKTGTGVQAYTSWNQGLEAVMKTLSFPNNGYEDIIAALRDSDAKDASGLFKAVNKSNWGYPKYKFDVKSKDTQAMMKYNPSKPFGKDTKNPEWYSELPGDGITIKIDEGDPEDEGDCVGLDCGKVEEDWTPDIKWYEGEDTPWKPKIDWRRYWPEGEKFYNPKQRIIDDLYYPQPMEEIRNFTGTLRDAANSIPRQKTRYAKSTLYPNTAYNIFGWGSKKWAKNANNSGEFFELSDPPARDVSATPYDPYGRQTIYTVPDANTLNVIDRPYGEQLYYWPSGGIGPSPKINPTWPGPAGNIWSPTYSTENFHKKLEKFFLSSDGETGYKNGSFTPADTKRAKTWRIQDYPDSLLQKFASGGYVNPSYYSNLPIPKFENGINMVPADMLAMLHKNEAVVPASMNPFNPNAQSYSQPSISYNIAPVINAAPGMDEQAIANMATRQVLAEMKIIDARNNASMGRPGTRVVGK